MLPLCDDFFGEDATNPLAPPARVNESSLAYLDAVRTYLLDLHDSGVPARRVNEEHSELVDRLVLKLFSVGHERYFANEPLVGNQGLAIVATGGYGRSELSLSSDLDLLFLYRGRMSAYVEALTEWVTYRLFDARLDVAHAVRTLRECERVGQADLPTLTSYLDARFLIGNPDLFAELERRLETWVGSDPGAFIEAKLAEQTDRHESFGESPFLLQPNLRESVGGLRDYHTALWIARAARWDVRSVDHLRKHSFTSEAEQAELQAALEFLWRLRNELHRPGRKDDRLHYEAQERVAERLEFKGDERTLPVEELMRAYYLHARGVRRVSRRVVAHALRLEARRTGHADAASRPLEDGFALARGQLEIPTPQLLRDRPVRLLSAFAVAQRHGIELSPRAESLIREHLGEIDDALRADPEARDVLVGILRGPDRVYRTLERMNDAGVLGAFLPEFGWVVGLWQHDLYHTYTVDAHSLFLVEQLRRLAKGLYDQELPLLSELVREVRSPEVLFLAAMLHDIGKGRGGGHSQKGADMVPAIAERLGLDARAADEIRFLVRHHLTLSGMAERRDVHDPRLILNVARLVGSRRRLRNLYLLTAADIRSVSREAWTGWKAGLLEALYRNVSEWMEAGVEDESASGFFLERAMERAQHNQSEAIRRVVEMGLSAERAQLFLESMPRRYLLTHGPSEIAEHLMAALEFLDSGQAAGIYAFRPEGSESAFQGLVVFAEDRPGLVATLCGIFAGAGRDVLGAQVYTTRSRLAVDIYELAPISSDLEVEEADRARLEERLWRVLAGDIDVAELAASRRSRLPGVARTRPPRVRISNDDSEFYTIVDVGATDRPGFLYDVTRALHGSGLDIFMSRVTTRASRVTDSFYVTDKGHKLLDPERMREIEHAILDAIEAGEP